MQVEIPNGNASMHAASVSRLASAFHMWVTYRTCFHHTPNHMSQFRLYCHTPRYITLYNTAGDKILQNTISGNLGGHVATPNVGCTVGKILSVYMCVYIYTSVTVYTYSFDSVIR